MKRQHGYSNFHKGKYLTELRFYGVRGLVHCHHGREHDSTKAGITLEKELLLQADSNVIEMI